VAVVWRHNVRFPSETGLDLRDDQPNIVQMVSIPDFETASAVLSWDRQSSSMNADVTVWQAAGAG
jgi:hypothetical protein